MLARLSLRARLVLGVIVLAALGLAVADFATYAALRSFLLERTDESLADTAQAVGNMLLHGGCPETGDRRPLPGTSPGDFVQVRSAQGEVVCSIQIVSLSDQDVAPPDLPESIDAPSGDSEAASFTVGAVGADGQYRVRASAGPFESGTIVVATSLDSLAATLRRLLLIELLVTAGVLAGLAALGLWVVRLGLRPLEAIETTAAAIAGGDLTRRVDRAEPHTEVGRLGIALNAMLGQIETAFGAREASERKLRRFVADASHELRTPLTAVRAYAELFGRGAHGRPEDLARSMEGIGRESERMSVLVEDLLLLARLDEGRPLERERVELDDVVGEAVDAAATVEPDRPITFEREGAVVLGDRDRLRQIVDNLLGNVRAHTPAGAPVEVRVARTDGSAVIEVADSGPGLSPDDAARVFERFYRADPSRARASGGIGLGLSIVAAVAEAHGGGAEVRSDPGAGATFAITLPLLDDETPDARQTQPRS